jgi:acyl-coenzyme A thioesterase 13
MCLKILPHPDDCQRPENAANSAAVSSRKTADRMTTAAAEGFTALFRSSPFLDRAGPFYSKDKGAALSIGLRVLEHHLNARGLVHGGVLLTMADIALGYAMATSENPPISAVTSQLSADFAGSARLGDWVQSRVDIQKIGRTLAFANVYLLVGDVRIVRASGVFAVTSKD